MKKRMIPALLTVISLTLLSSVCTWRSDVRQREVRMAYPPIVASLPMFVAEEQKLFEHDDVVLKKTPLANSNDMMNALVADQVDVLPAVSLIPIIHLEIQSPGKARVFSHSRMRPDRAFDSLIIKETSDIKTLKDLEKKKIGVFPGTSATKMLTAFLQSKGVDVKDISFIQLAPPSQLASIESGAIDALFTYEPVTTTALKKGGYRTLFGSVYADLLDPCPIGASVISRNFERNNPELAAGAIGVIDRGVSFMRERPDAAKSFLTKFTEIPPNIASSVNVVDVTLSGENDVQNLQKFIDLLFEIGEIKERIDARRLLDPSR